MLFRIIKDSVKCKACIEPYGVIVNETRMYYIVEATESDIELFKQKYPNAIVVPEVSHKVKLSFLSGNNNEIYLDEIKTLVGFDILENEGFNDKDIVISVIDTGVNLDVLPEDIRSRVIVKDYTGEGINDYIGHGTSITYILGRLTKNAKILNIKAIRSDLTTTSRSLLDAFEDAYWDSHVCNVSWTLGDACNSYKAYNSLMQFISMADLPLYLVASAGNEDGVWNSVGFPACSEYAIAVGAIDKNGNIADFSSRGAFECDGHVIPKPDLSTYGVGIETIDKNGQTVFLNGTSFSAPIVSAFIAWIYNAYAIDMRERILEPHVVNPRYGYYKWDNEYGNGILRAFASQAVSPIQAQMYDLAMMGFMITLPVVFTVGSLRSVKKTIEVVSR